VSFTHVAPNRWTLNTGPSKRDEDREMLPFKAQRSLPQAMTIGMWSGSLATKCCC